MEIVYIDDDIIVCIKPAGILSTDEEGGLPEILREQVGGDVRTVHRLDRATGGLMVLARSKKAASALSAKIREDEFEKRYLAVVHGKTQPSGELRHLMYRDKARKMSFITDKADIGVQEAVLEYTALDYIPAEDISLVRIRLITGRTHQIRCQFAHCGFPLLGERKYSTFNDPCRFALWSEELSFPHPASGEALTFRREPPSEYPWTMFPQGEVYALTFCKQMINSI